MKNGIGGLSSALSLAACSAALLAGCGGSSQPKGVRGASEVAAQAIKTSGNNPFMPSVGKDMNGVKPPATAVTSGPATYTASLPGLYGGTRNYATCDASKLIAFLQQNQSKALAWSLTLGISESEIPSYVAGLTPVLLRTDTRVTNHGYVNGVADPIQSVLEAGTAVFVNRYGEPVVKCYCGNPLTPPIAYAAPVYSGPLWTGFDVTHITIIVKSTTIINTFTLYDPHTGMTFSRPGGTSGTRDGPYAQPASTNTTPTTTTGTTPAPAPAPQPAPQTTPTTAASENPSASFSPNPGMQGDTFTLSASGFNPGAQLDVTLTRPDGVVEHYSISVGGDGTGTYTFTNTQNVVTGTYSATVTNPATGASAQTSLDVAPAG